MGILTICVVLNDAKVGEIWLKKVKCPCDDQYKERLQNPNGTWHGVDKGLLIEEKQMDRSDENRSYPSHTTTVSVLLSFGFGSWLCQNFPLQSPVKMLLHLLIHFLSLQAYTLSHKVGFSPPTLLPLVVSDFQSNQ